MEAIAGWRDAMSPSQMFIAGGVTLALSVPFSLWLYSRRYWSVPSGPHIAGTADKAVLITGCDSGFGLQLAKVLDQRGFTVFACCLSDQSSGAEELKDLSSHNMHVLKLDVTKPQEVQDTLKSVQVWYDAGNGLHRMYALVNNAGIACFMDAEWCQPATLRRIMEVNVFGTVAVTQAFLPLIRKSKGRVVNVASVAGRVTVMGFTAYSMSKHAVVSFTDGLRQEMKRFGVKVIIMEMALYKTAIANAEIMHAGIERDFAQASQTVKDDYGENYTDRFIDMADRSMLSKASRRTYLVLDCLVDAVCSATPRPRYIPTVRERVTCIVGSILPITISDKLFRRLGYYIK